MTKFSAFSQVGNTPLIKLDSKFSGHGASVWLKVGSGNPTEFSRTEWQFQ